MGLLNSNEELSSMTIKERAAYATEIFKRIADQRGIKLKLIKK